MAQDIRQGEVETLKEDAEHAIDTFLTKVQEHRSNGEVTDRELYETFIMLVRHEEELEDHMGLGQVPSSLDAHDRAALGTDVAADLEAAYYELQDAKLTGLDYFQDEIIDCPYGVNDELDLEELGRIAEDATGPGYHL